MISTLTAGNKWDLVVLRCPKLVLLSFLLRVIFFRQRWHFKLPRCLITGEEMQSRNRWPSNWPSDAAVNLRGRSGRGLGSNLRVPFFFTALVSFIFFTDSLPLPDPVICSHVNRSSFQPVTTPHTDMFRRTRRQKRGEAAFCRCNHTPHTHTHTHTESFHSGFHFDHTYFTMTGTCTHMHMIKKRYIYFILLVRTLGDDSPTGPCRGRWRLNTSAPELFLDSNEKKHTNKAGA